MTEKTTDSANLSEFDPERRKKPAINEDESRDEAMLYEQGIETAVDADPNLAAQQQQERTPSDDRPVEAASDAEIPSGDLHDKVNHGERYEREPDTGSKVETS